MINSFYSEKELCELGFHSIGKNVRISKKASFYGEKNISIGNNVRIDDFCLLSGKLCLGNNIHISAGVYMYGGEAGIVVKDFSTISSRTVIYAVNDDYSGEFMACSAVDEKYRNVTKKEVIIEKHVAIGTGCTILPGLTLGEGSAIGAMSLVKNDTKPWFIYAGIPCRQKKERSRRILEIEKEMFEEL